MFKDQSSARNPIGECACSMSKSNHRQVHKNPRTHRTGRTVWVRKTIPVLILSAMTKFNRQFTTVAQDRQKTNEGQLCSILEQRSRIAQDCQVSSSRTITSWVDISYLQRASAPRRSYILMLQIKNSLKFSSSTVVSGWGDRRVKDIKIYELSDCITHVQKCRWPQGALQNWSILEVKSVIISLEEPCHSSGVNA